MTDAPQLQAIAILTGHAYCYCASKKLTKESDKSALRSHLSSRQVAGATFDRHALLSSD
jgi:hypothetical protein